MATKFEVGMTYAYDRAYGVTEVYVKRRTAKSVWLCMSEDRLISTKYPIYIDSMGEYVKANKYGGRIYSYHPY